MKCKCKLTVLKKEKELYSLLDWCPVVGPASGSDLQVLVSHMLFCKFMWTRHWWLQIGTASDSQGLLKKYIIAILHRHIWFSIYTKQNSLLLWLPAVFNINSHLI